jgi:hypothetical protein
MNFDEFLMKIYVKFHENHVKISWKMWSETEIDRIFHEIYIDFKPIYLGGELKVYSFLKDRYSNPRNTQATMLGF